MPKKNLTTNERDVIKLVCLGKTQTQAVFDVYNCKNKQTAGAMATKIFKRPMVKALLEKGLAESDQSLVKGVQQSIQEELQDMGIDRKEILERFKELLYSNDLRVVQQMIDLWSKWTGAYAPTKALLLSKSEIFTEVKELEEE